MDPLRLSALGPATAGVATPVQALPKAAQAGAQATGTTLIQGLAQNLAQTAYVNALQAAVPSASDTAIATGSPGGVSAAFTGTLLAALDAAAAVSPTTTGTAIAPAPAVAAPALPTTPALAAPQLTTATPTAPAALADSTSPDFALLTALRFGAGVGALGAPAVQTPELGAGLVRDAAAVARIVPLRSQTGGPGPEAFTQAGTAAAPQALAAYRAPAVAEAHALDLMA